MFFIKLENIDIYICKIIPDILNSTLLIPFQMKGLKMSLHHLLESIRSLELMYQLGVWQIDALKNPRKEQIYHYLVEQQDTCIYTWECMSSWLHFQINWVAAVLLDWVIVNCLSFLVERHMWSWHWSNFKHFNKWWSQPRIFHS